MPRSKRVTPPANGEGAHRGASLLPENYTDGDDETGIPASELVVGPSPALRSAASAHGDGAGVTEAIVTVEPVGAAPGTVTSAPRQNPRYRGLRPFPKGTSGNPNGRPKGIVSKALTKELKRKIAASGQTMLQALVSGYVAKALEEQDPARFNSIRDTVDGKPVSQDDGAGVNVGIIVQLEIVGK